MQAKIDAAAIEDAKRLHEKLNARVKGLIDEREAHRKATREMLVELFGAAFADYTMNPAWFPRAIAADDPNAPQARSLPENAIIRECEQVQHERGEVARQLRKLGVEVEPGPQIEMVVKSERPKTPGYSQALAVKKGIAHTEAELKARREQSKQPQPAA